MYHERRKLPPKQYTLEDRRSYSAEFKTRVALAAMMGDKNMSELALEFAIQPSQIQLWKQQFIDNIDKVFENNAIKSVKPDMVTENQHVKIGQLMAENDFLTKVLGRKL